VNTHSHTFISDYFLHFLDAIKNEIYLRFEHISGDYFSNGADINLGLPLEAVALKNTI
jgi:hypothetical protein